MKEKSGPLVKVYQCADCDAWSYDAEAIRKHRREQCIDKAMRHPKASNEPKVTTVKRG